MATELVQLASIIFLMHVETLHAQKFMRGCVFESSSRLRTRDATFTVRDIDFTLCTHYIYASAQVDINGLTVEPADRKDEEGLTGLYKQFNDGKKKLKGTKTILSVRGAVASTDTSNGFEYIIQTDPSFKRFPQNAVKYVRDHGFDGINIDWPIGIANNSTQVLSTLLRALRKVIDQDNSSKLLLTITGSASLMIINTNYNVTELNLLVDYVFVNSRWLVSLRSASFIAPLYSKYGVPGGSNSLNFSIQFWKEKSMPYSKLVMGVVALGHYVQLKDPTSFHPGAEATRAVLRGYKYSIGNRLAYPEICALMDISQKYFDTVQKSAYLVHGDEWIGYIDKASLYERIKFVRKYGLAGIYFMNLDEDDFSGTECKAGKFPLVTYLRDRLDLVKPTVAPPETATVMIDTTSETQTDNNSDLTTTVEINGKHVPTTTTTRTVTEHKRRKRDSISFLGYMLLISEFIIGYIIGFLFMRFAREMYKKATGESI